jgi:hypothetical protein
VNAFLWMGLVCTAILIASIVLDGLDDAFDAVDLGPPWLSVSAVLAFLGAFGFGTGAFVGDIGAAAAIPGLAAGVGFAWLAVKLTAAAIHLPTGSVDTEEAMLGSLGRIVTEVTPARLGEALLHRPAGPRKVACSADAALAAGTEIVVVDVRSPTLVHVQAFDLALPPDPPTTEENSNRWNPS